MTAIVMRHDARELPFPDGSVDLVVTSPPYYGQRSYTDGGVHYAGQIGDEPTPGEYIENLLACTAEWARVLKPTGSIFVNLGDSYSRNGGGKKGGSNGVTGRGERTSRRAIGHDMTREDAAWLAGVIDSDGSVSIHVNKQPEGRAPSFVAYTDHPGTGESSGPSYAAAIADGGYTRTDYSTELHHRPKVGPWREYHIDRWAPAPTTPAVVLDPFGGTGTTALVAHVLGRVGISNDKSDDYCRLAQWRTTDPDQLAKAMRVPKPPKQIVGQADLFGDPTSWEVTA